MQIKPIEIQIKSIDGELLDFRISRIPAIAGREIMTQYIPSLIKSEYKVNETLMFKLLSYVDAKKEDGGWIALDNRAIIDHYCKSWEDIIKIEKEMVQYNTNFLQKEKVSDSLTKFTQTLPKQITKILTPLLRALQSKN